MAHRTVTVGHLMDQARGSRRARLAAVRRAGEGNATARSAAPLAPSSTIEQAFWVSA